MSIQVQLMLGPTVPVPAPAIIAQALHSLEVVNSNEAPSAFQLTFRFKRGDGLVGAATDILMTLPLFKVFNRVIVSVIFKSLPHVLIDGIITHQQVKPSEEPGMMDIILTGEDVSVMMDRNDVNAAHPAQNAYIIANKLIAKYAIYGMIPAVIPPAVMSQPLPTDPAPMQTTTDYKYLQEMAKPFNYDFFVVSGPVPLTNLAYWGPKIRVGIPQKTLSVDMGNETNVIDLDFEHDAARPTIVQGIVIEKNSGLPLPILALVSLQIPLASLPTLLTNLPFVRQETLRVTGDGYPEAFAKAQGMLEQSTNEVVTGRGSVDVLKYDGIIHARSLIGVRGAGFLYDGFYYVKKVTHRLNRGQFTQSFEIVREGLGSTTPVVIP